MTAPLHLAALAAPLDGVRSALLRLLAPRGRLFLGNRAARVALYGAVGLAVSLALALVAPMWAFALGPLVLGVPHVLADVRYLVVRHGLHRRRALAWAVGVPLLASVAMFHPAVGLASGFGAIAFARTTPARRACAAAAWAALVLLAVWRPRASQLALLHLHNALAVVLFLVVFARSRVAALGLSLGLAAAATALLAGAFDAIITRASAASSPSSVDLWTAAEWLAPVGDAVMGLRLTVLFVLAQGFHYVLWLRVIPEEARERPGLRSFASSAAALEREVGSKVLVVCALAGVAVLARAVTSLEEARIFYLHAAGFHAYLELAFALLLVLEGQRLLAPAGRGVEAQGSRQTA